MKLRKLAAVLLTVLVCVFMMPTAVSAAQTKGITLNKTNISMTVGKTYTLTKTVTGVKNATIVWKTSDSSVASVSKGKITAKKVGSAVITASIKGTDYKATCKVKVKKPSFDSMEEFAESDLSKLKYKSISAKKSNAYDFVLGFSGADSLYIDSETVDGSEGMELACDSKGNIALKYDFDGERLDIILKNKKVYLLDPASKTGMYITLDDSEFEDYADEMKDAFEELASIDESLISVNEKIRSCDITIDGKNYTVETVDDGYMLFDSKGTIRAIVSDDKSADVYALIINEYSTNVPSGMFSIPKGYDIVDLDSVS